MNISEFGGCVNNGPWKIWPLMIISDLLMSKCQNAFRFAFISSIYIFNNKEYNCLDASVNLQSISSVQESELLNSTF